MNCYAGTAQVSGPGDLPVQAVRDRATTLSWVHSWTHGQFILDLYRQSQAGQLINAQVTAASLGLFPGDPYFDAVDGYFGQSLPRLRGAVADSLYVQEQIGGTTRVYQGFTATGRFGIGKNVVVIPSFTTASTMVTAADPRYLGLNSTLILDAQIPGRPLHTGNLTIDAFQPWSGMEFLANVALRRPEQQPVHRAVRHRQPRALAPGWASGASPCSHRTCSTPEAGDFSTLQYARADRAQRRRRRCCRRRIRTLRAQYTVTYSFNTGARPGAGFSRGPRAQPRPQTAAASGASAAAARRPGFGRLKFIAAAGRASTRSASRRAARSARPTCSRKRKRCSPSSAPR